MSRPSKPTTHTIDTGGAKIRLTRSGDGPPIFLLHGGPGCYDYFAGSELIDWLAETHTVHSYDQRGCRDSISGGPFTLADNIADLDALRRHFGYPRIDLLGHSAGAILAVHYAAAHRDHVDRMAMLSPAGIRPGWRRFFDATLHERFTDDQRRALDQLDRRILRTPDRHERAELYRRRFTAALPAYVDPGRRDVAPEMKHYNRDVNVACGASIQQTYGDSSWSDALADFDHPVCIIHGRSDPIPWRVVDDLIEVFPHARILPIERCGHFPWLERPDACRDALVAFQRERG